MPDFELEDHAAFRALDEQSKLLVKSAVGDQEMFQKFVIADILDRRTLCRAHDLRITRIERVRKLVSMAVAMVVAVASAIAGWLWSGK